MELLSLKYCFNNYYPLSEQVKFPTLCIQFLGREKNDKNNTLPLGKQICFIIVWDSAEILPSVVIPITTKISHRMRDWGGRIGSPKILTLKSKGGPIN